MYESTIRAYQGILSSWVFEKPTCFPEEFAIKRFQKKMEVPDHAKEAELHAKAWNDYLERDEALPSEYLLLSPEWVRVKNRLNSWLRGDRTRSPIDFPKGSSVCPTRGQNSIEFRLSGGAWTCTPENFDEFSTLVYNHKALKRAFRRRYTSWYRKGEYGSRKKAEKLLWETFRKEKDPSFAIFQFKLSRIVTFVRGSRFSTVPKNNSTRRPINVEPFGNLLVQRQLGNFFRSCLKRQGINLDTLAEEHRMRLKDPTVATIDLSNASDSISQALVRLLIPKRYFKVIERSRSHLLYGADREYHIPKKISSMGNGFTFELMTLILLALCRELDPDSSVFGDDIIISKQHASKLIFLLREVGLVVNEEKSFINGPFRESCGGNFHDDFGYLKSFDFLYPTTVGDCAVILSKCFELRHFPAFRKLYLQLLKRTPIALRGGSSENLGPRHWDEADLCVSFPVELQELPLARGKLARKLSKTLFLKELRIAIEFQWTPDLRTKTTSTLKNNRHWAKFEMFLASNRVCDDVISGSGRWVRKILYITESGTYRFTEQYLRDVKNL